jgi:hypothetical protein
LSTDDETDSTTDANPDGLFDSSDDDETDITSGANTDSPEGLNDGTDDNAYLFGNEEQQPPEHYFDTAVKLDVLLLGRPKILYSCCSHKHHMIRPKVL